jgi:hypothetical protein
LPARHLGRSWLAVAAVAPRVAAPRQWPIARGQALRVAIIGCARRAGALDAGAPAVAEQRVRIFGQLATTRSRMSSVARGPMLAGSAAVALVTDRDIDPRGECERADTVL